MTHGGSLAKEREGKVPFPKWPVVHNCRFRPRAECRYKEVVRQGTSHMFDRRSPSSKSPCTAQPPCQPTNCSTPIQLKGWFPHWPDANGAHGSHGTHDSNEYMFVGVRKGHTPTNTTQMHNYMLANDQSSYICLSHLPSTEHLRLAEKPSGQRRFA
jgi:hypothetical protein